MDTEEILQQFATVPISILSFLSNIFLSSRQLKTFFSFVVKIYLILSLQKIQLSLLIKSFRSIFTDEMSKNCENEKNDKKWKQQKIERSK